MKNKKYKGYNSEEERREIEEGVRVEQLEKEVKRGGNNEGKKEGKKE